ncbi:MFS transporter [Bacteroidota bacterium]|nr:MFS transporter [Bacteroidota bacterium]
MELSTKNSKSGISIDSHYLKAFELMCCAKYMAIVYEENRAITKYVHSTSRGHEAIQLATAFQLKPCDFAAPYYRDESMLLGMGWEPYELMLQLLAKKDDPFSGGRSYYSHPSSRRKDRPVIPHQSSATGMQAIPATGMAQGVQYLEKRNLLKSDEPPVVLCSFGDGSVTEGEVSEAFQFAVLKQLPIIYLVQDNEWGISASADETRVMDAYDYAAGFKGLKRVRVDGSEYHLAHNCMKDAIEFVRTQRKPILVHAKVPLLGHHTSGVRKEWYRTEEDLKKHYRDDPFPKLRSFLLKMGVEEKWLNETESQAKEKVYKDFERAVASPDPEPESVMLHEFAETTVTEETGNRSPEGREKVVMVDSALHAVDEILKANDDAIFFGQDVGRRLGGVFREAATLAEKYGDDRVFNTAIQEAYIVGSTAGLSAVGVKAMVEIQFADYIWSGVNQLVTELSKSCYLTMGKFPVNAVIRIPIGAYGGGGPYHSGCIESSILAVRGIKVCYPSNAADMKGLLKAAFLDPNPVVMFEHKGLYWSKVPGTDEAKTIEPAEDYILPLGKANIVQQASEDELANGNTVTVITYGMGVYWAKNASKNFPGSVEIVDLRTLNPLDEEMVLASVRRHGKCIVLTEEPVKNSFAQSLAGKISELCFQSLDAPVKTIGAKSLPAVALNMGLEKAMLPNAEIVAEEIGKMLNN